MPTAGTICRFPWQIEVSTLNHGLRVTVDGTTETLTIATGVYFWLDDGTSGDMVLALKTALDSHSKPGAFTVALNADGTLSLSMATSAWTIKWADALTTFDHSWAGMPSADVTGTLSGGSYRYTGPDQVAHLWNPETRYTDDTGLKQDHEISRIVDNGGQPDTWRWWTQNYREILLDVLPYSKVFSADAATNEAFGLFLDWLSQGGKFIWVPDIASPTVWTTWHIQDLQFLKVWPVQQHSDLSRFYRILLPMLHASAVSAGPGGTGV